MCMQFASGLEIEQFISLFYCFHFDKKKLEKKYWNKREAFLILEI